MSGTPAAGPGERDATTPQDALSAAIAAQEKGLQNCVHCGFCLPVCPTYRRLGDEADSPRGRLYLMRAVTEGRLEASSDAFQVHIDRCLGCRACEPVCPSGVEYGALLELARERGARHRRSGLLTRLLLGVMGSRALRGVFFLGGRLLRSTGLAAMGAAVVPGRGPGRNAKLGLAMLASSRRWVPLRGSSGGRALVAASPNRAGDDGRERTPQAPSEGTTPPFRGRVAVLSGCVQQGLYERINRATVRTLEANGYQVVAVRGQDCCGALHAHGGQLEAARALARRNIDAFEAASVDHVAVNAAGCGAAMKEYGSLLALDETYQHRAMAVAGRIQDVTELLAAAGPRTGAAVRCTVAYDHPCHLLHAQGVSKQPLDVLAAVPEVEVRLVANADECCGGAGIYGMTHPDLGGRIGRDKVDAVRAEDADVGCTPNPGCMMQIGAGLRLSGSPTGMVHPVELLDESYARAGYYQ